MKQRLTTKEEELMNVFWRRGDLCIRELVDNIDEPKPSYNTIAKQVAGLEEKGFLERKPIANTFIYKVVISEKEYRGQSIGDMVSKYYKNSYPSLVLQFVKDEKLNIDELKEIIDLIEKEK